MQSNLTIIRKIGLNLLKRVSSTRKVMVKENKKMIRKILITGRS